MSKIIPDSELNQLRNLLRYSDRYEISIQFWPDQTAVYISKDGVELKDFGGDFEPTIQQATDYLNRITPTP